MKKILFAMVMAVSFTGVANAESYAVSGVVTDVQPQYSNIANRIPQQSCSVVDVPVYGNSGGATVFGLDVEGAIVGGIIGNQIGNSKGNGAAGAVIGGLLGNQNQNRNRGVVGYRQEQRCNTTYTTEYQQQYNGSIVIVDVNGMKVSGRTNRQVNVGDTISVQMDLRIR